MRGIEPRFARRSVPKKEMKANRDSHYTTSEFYKRLRPLLVPVVQQHNLLGLVNGNVLGPW